MFRLDLPLDLRTVWAMLSGPKVLYSSRGMTEKTQLLGVSGFVWHYEVTDSKEFSPLVLRTEDISKRQLSVGMQRDVTGGLG